MLVISRQQVKQRVPSPRCSPDGAGADQRHGPDASTLRSGRRAQTVTAGAYSSTTMTELSVPKQFGTRGATGQQVHSPSTTYLYSYRPGGRSSTATKTSLPLRSRLILRACESQPLKSPARKTFLAPGHCTANLTFANPIPILPSRPPKHYLCCGRQRASARLVVCFFGCSTRRWRCEARRWLKSDFWKQVFRDSLPPTLPCQLGRGFTALQPPVFRPPYCTLRPHAPKCRRTVSQT